MRRKLASPAFTQPPVASKGPFGAGTRMAGVPAPEPGANNDLPAGVMPLPYDHPLGGLQSQIHRTLPKRHPLKPLQQMLRPDLPGGHPLRQMRAKLMGRMR